MTEAREFEQLEQLARFSWERARELCLPEHGCADYHQTWSLVRLLQLGGKLPAGAEFFRHELGALARAGRKRVLVSGGADTGVTAMVVEGYRLAGQQPHIVFIDRCETPCAQNRILMREQALEGEVRCMDALQMAGEPVDVVVSHSFLHRFDGEQRQQLLHAWAGMLEPGGLMMLSVTLAQDEQWQRVVDPVAVQERSRALVAAAIQAGWSAVDAQELGARAASAWRVSARRPPAMTRQWLADGLAQAGFDLRDIRLQDPVSSPANLGTRPEQRNDRAEVVAVKR